MKLTYTVISDSNYTNVRQVLKNEFKMSNRLILKLKQNRLIYLNNSVTYLDKELTLGDQVICAFDFDESSDNIIPIKMNLNILFEDDYLLAINKPYNMAVHPSILHYTNSLSNGVQYYFQEKGINKKIRPVNRLDRDTTGIVIFAKNEYIQECLVKQMQVGQFYKEYIAVLEGILDQKEGTIDVPISRKEGSIIERCIDIDDGEKAITNYSVIKENNNLSLVKFILVTGRTHQIRLHSKYIGHPILGDSMYGKESSLINRQALHCYKLCFIHPVTNKELEIISQIPSDIKNLIDNIIK